MATRWLDEREDRAWRGLMEMQDGLSEFVEHRLRSRCQMSLADYQVLAHLSEAPEGQLRSFRLGELLHWEKSRLSQHLGRMQNRGLVSRERCLTDQRGAVVAITPRGSSSIETAARQHVADVHEAFIDHLSATELDLLSTLCTKVSTHLALLNQHKQGTRPSKQAGEPEPAGEAAGLRGVDLEAQQLLEGRAQRQPAGGGGVEDGG